MRKLSCYLLAAVSIFMMSCDRGDRYLPGALGLLPGSGDAVTPGQGGLLKTGNVPESAADKLLSSSDAALFGANRWNEADFGSCDSANTAVITVYSTNAAAQSAIEVGLDGVGMGTLSTYYSGSLPDCKAPESAGVMTRLVSAGDHYLEAVSPNLRWPRYDFSIRKCACMTIQLP